MKIYSMTATFGKLEHETLTLEPGLNIIQAPNEWGKSTWCAFLVNMLYGIETRTKTTKTALAEKEHYAPWSGSPMAGRIELNWKGRDITIERSSKGRVPLGQFRAYETDTGLEVPELTALNCGQTLLGVERSVFTRSAFLRFSDLPVTNDEALRRRLNALVTTGDESGSAEALGQKIRDLKNKCRYNRSGLLPQAEAQRDALERKLNEQSDIAQQSQRLKKRQEELSQWAAQLDNHKTALQYAAAQDGEKQIKDAVSARDEATRQLRDLEAQCRNLPSREEAQQSLQELNRLRQNWDSLQMEEQMLPEAPAVPTVPAQFQGITPEDAIAQAKTDSSAYQSLRPPKKPMSPLFFALAAAAVVAGAVLMVLGQMVFGIAALGVGAVLLAVGLMGQKAHQAQAAVFQSQQLTFQRRYGSNNPMEWITAAQQYANEQQVYRDRLAAYQWLRGDLDSRRAVLRQQLAATGAGSLTEKAAHWNRVMSLWDKSANAARALQQAENQLQALQSMAKPAEAPKLPDQLTFSEDETNNLLSQAAYDQRQLQMQLGQCQGQMTSLGSGDALRQELEGVNKRIDKLELTYAALDYAQKALNAASAELQRRFAPRISKRAQELFAQLTGGRYDRLTLTEELTLHAGAKGEDTLRPQQWRSDGTVDQLYLALRLAVAQELMPDSPLILDDALVRFDDTRLAEALKILRQEAESKQVLLFTCQSREKELL